MSKEKFTVDENSKMTLRIILLVIYIIVMGVLIHIKARDYNMRLEENNDIKTSAINEQQELNEQRIAANATGVLH